LLENGTEDQRKLIRSAIEQAEELPEDLFQQVYSAIMESKAIAYTQEVAEKEAKLAKEALACFPKNEATQSLLDLCDYSLKRST
jgi:octaprenyl-diphosphate synthase